jgi:hypothetical protein
LEPNQLNLFPDVKPTPARRAEALVMSADALLKWKAQIFDYQPFWRMPADSPGDACLYFVVDSAADLILYVGETCRSNKRWKGIHACKDYIASYQDLHYRYEMKTAVNIAFWWDAPVDRRARQELELSLILKWRSPFNKENWERWGQPFS